MSLFQCITCPAEDNATFAVCPWSTQFVGCCKQIITCDESCSSDDLRPTSFLPECFSQIHNQICPPDSQWYTCNDTNPTFMGCCKQNACANGGCSSAYLAAATLSSNPEDAHDYIPLDVTSDTSVKKYHTAVIAASSVGGVVLLSIVLAFLVLYRHRKAKRSRKAHKEFVRASAKVVEKTDSVAAPAEPIAQAPNQARYEISLPPAPVYGAYGSQNASAPPHPELHMNELGDKHHTTFGPDSLPPHALHELGDQ